MVRYRLRTKFLLSLIAITTALTSVTLLIVRHRVRLQVRAQIFEALRNSVGTFQNFQRQREVTLARVAELLANLPSLKALMTTEDAATIQDASADFWRLGGSDLFVLADRAGRVVALHTVAPSVPRSDAQELLRHSLERGERRDWWLGNGHLYEVFLQPIYFGSAKDNLPLGVLAVGYEIDDRVAAEVSRVASSEVAFRYGDTLVVSTLPASQQGELTRQIGPASNHPVPGPEELQLGEERFLATSLELNPGATPLVRLNVLKSFDQATRFLSNLNRALIAVGLAAVLAGGALVFLISHTFTRPRADLVAGVRALEKGDFGYPLAARGRDEAAELTGAFDRMRQSLQKTQEELLHAERLATMGRMASSISHDLRHPLTAILAYAEFLAESNLDEPQRKDLYQEIRVAVNQMTELIGSLLEFSRARDALQMVFANVEDTLKNAIQIVQAQPDFRRVSITLTCEGPTQGWFDPKKLQRVFQNLLLNACEAAPPDTGRIEVKTRQTPQGLEIRVIDNGPGIPEAIRDKLFRPFVSYGKTHGTGLGLAVVQKIVQDHGGNVRAESPAGEGATFELTLPLRVPR